MNHAKSAKIVENNLEVVERHLMLEAVDIEKALELYTDDIVWESSRGIACRGKDAVRENYQKLFSSMTDIELVPLERFATEDRVVDDTLVRFTFSRDGIPNAPLAVGSRVEMRLVHIFEIRSGKIAREKVFEMWREAQNVN